MKSKTTNQLAEIGKSSEALSRLKAELAERTATLAALQDKERTVGTQLHTTAAELVAKTRSLEEIEQQLSHRRAEFAKFMAEFNLHPELAKAESRHAAEVESLKADKAAVEAELIRSREECARLQDHIDSMTKQVETTWASERMANAVLRERINDVASEVVRVAVALEGLNSPIDSLVAGKAASAQAQNDAIALTGESREISLPSALDVAEGTSTELIHRIRALRQRTARTPATS
jgi:chromosome segregation ATPase